MGRRPQARPKLGFAEILQADSRKDGPWERNSNLDDR